MSFSVSPQQIVQFRADGFLLVEDLYTAEEMDLLLQIGKTDTEKNEMVHAPRDAQGRESKLWLTSDTDLSLIHI